MKNHKQICCVNKSAETEWKREKEEIRLMCYMCFCLEGITHMCKRKLTSVTEVRHESLKHLHVLGGFIALLLYEYLLAVVLSFS